MTLFAPITSSRLRDRSPIFVVAPSRCFPPVECWRGTRPNQAAKSRPLRKCSGGGASVAKAMAISGPMPGIVIKRRAISSSFDRRVISVSSTLISASNWPNVVVNTLRMGIAAAGKPMFGSLVSAISFAVWPPLAARSVRTRPDVREGG